MYIVDLHKSTGSTIEFHKWYGDLQQALGSLISRRKRTFDSAQRSSLDGSDGTEASAAASARAAAAPLSRRGSDAAELGQQQQQQQRLPGREQRQSGTPTYRRTVSAFELLNSTFGLEAMFDSGEAASAARHVQFSSRCSPAEIFDALEKACRELGGQVQQQGDKT